MVLNVHRNDKAYYGREEGGERTASLNLVQSLEGFSALKGFWKEDESWSEIVEREGEGGGRTGRGRGGGGMCKSVHVLNWYNYYHYFI